ERGDVSGLPASPPIRRRRRRPAGSRGGVPAGRGRDHPPPRERGAVGVLGDDRGPRRAGGNGGPPGGGRGRAPPERGPAVHAPCGGPGFRVLEAGRLLRSTMIRCRGVVRAARIAVAVTSVLAPAVALAAGTPKPGGSITVTLREDLPQGFNIHETSTV